MADLEPDDETDQRGFSATRWSLFQRLQAAEMDGHSSELPHLLDQVLAVYRVPLHNHLVRQMQLSSHDADDVLQDFLVAKDWLRDLIEKANRAKGRFRALLLVSLRNFVRDWWDKRNAIKQQPNRASVETEQFDYLAAGAMPDLYCIDAARSVLSQAIARTRDRSKPERWRLFARQVLVPHLHGQPALTGKEAAQTFGLRDANEVDSVLVNCKRMFKKCLHGVVAEYAHDEAEIQFELAELEQALAQHDGRDFDLPDDIAQELRALADQQVPVSYNTQLSRLFLLADPDATLKTQQQRQNLQLLLTSALADLALDLPAELESFSTWSVGRALSDRATPLGILQRLKDQGRRWIESDLTPWSAEIGVAVYFSAIAAAALFHRQPISQSTDAKLQEGVQRLLATCWLPEELQVLLQEYEQSLLSR